MCKKFFHPASRDNLKRVWMAEQRTEAEQKKQDDLRQQYEREQEIFNNKALLSKESKEKLSLNFMYEPPPGTRKDEKEQKETEYKFEWQRTWGTAPRESWAKGDEAIKDQPFGIQVRNVRCVKCHKYGHINTDKECPLYGKAMDSETPVGTLDQNKLLEEMKEDGMKMRWSAWDMQDDARIKKYDMVSGPTSSKSNDQLDSLKNMSKKDKLKLLKKLEKMEKRSKKKKKKEKKHKRERERSSSSSEDTSEDDKRREKKSKSHRRDRDKSTSRDRNRDRSRSRSRDQNRDRSRSRSRDRKHKRRHH